MTFLALALLVAAATAGAVPPPDCYSDCAFADLSGADLRWADLSGAEFNYADLSDADLRWANIANVRGCPSRVDTPAMFSDC